MQLCTSCELLFVHLNLMYEDTPFQGQGFKKWIPLSFEKQC